MDFRDCFPDYKSYEDDEYYYSKIPAGLNGAVCGLLNRAVQEGSTLKAICYELAGRIPTEPTQNWGRDWLLRDLDDLLRQLSQKKFPSYMDFLMWAVNKIDDKSFLEDLNDAMEDVGLGYFLSAGGPRGYQWQPRKEANLKSTQLLTAKEAVKDICAQAADHIRKAIQHLQDVNDPRARKDALRDSLSAMEALVKQLAGKDNFDDAVRALRADASYGNEFIVKDGLGIWNRIHDLYPDVRHGSPDASDLPHVEAIYWIDRIMVYVGYLRRMRRDP